MRAAVITALTGPDAVEVQERPEPVPESHQVLIDVEYAGVTFPDVLQTRGLYQRRPDLPFTPGWEVSGVVRADVGGFRAGDRVAAMPITGGFAGSVAVDGHMVFPIPDGLPFDKAAALPLNYLTVQFALVHRAWASRCNSFFRPTRDLGYAGGDDVRRVPPEPPRRRELPLLAGPTRPALGARRLLSL